MTRGDVVICGGGLFAVWAVEGEAVWLRLDRAWFPILVVVPSYVCVSLEGESVEWVGYEVN